MSFIIKRKYFKTTSYYLECWLLFVAVLSSIMNIFSRRSQNISSDLSASYLHGRSAGKPELLLNMNDEIKCVSCGLCVKACPANSIDIKTSTAKSQQLTEGKAPVSFMLDVSTCFNCGYCQIICPVNALGMDGEYMVEPKNNWINLAECAKQNKQEHLSIFIKK